MATLKLIKMGCDFWNDDELKKHSDLENYRLRLSFIDKENNEIIGDIGQGYKRKFNFKNGKELKKPSKVHNLKIYTDFQIDMPDGHCYQYKPKYINAYVDKYDLRYNSVDLLKLINHLSKDTYDNIEIVSR